MSRATDFLVKRRIESASDAFLPRIRSSTSFAFWGEVLRKRERAWASSMARLPYFAGGGGAAPGAPAAAAILATFSTLEEWPLNWRVGANSPSLWPTMFSVM
jgi:hypothetical protein